MSGNIWLFVTLSFLMVLIAILGGLIARSIPDTVPIFQILLILLCTASGISLLIIPTQQKQAIAALEIWIFFLLGLGGAIAWT